MAGAAGYQVPPQERPVPRAAFTAASIVVAKLAMVQEFSGGTTTLSGGTLPVSVEGLFDEVLVVLPPDEPPLPPQAETSITVAASRARELRSGAVFM